MNALDLMARVGGEILSHKIRVTINGEIVVLAKLNGNDWELTEKGQALANEQSNVAEVDATPKARKKPLVNVESATVTTSDKVGIDVTPSK